MRLEKVEAYEERIAALERQVAELTPPVVEPTAEPSDDVVTMSEIEYLDWLEEEMLRMEIRVAKMDELIESDDPVRIITALAEILEMVFDFHDDHSRIRTTSPIYDEIQPALSCVVNELEPLRNIEDVTVAEALTILAPMFVELMDNPDDFLSECGLDALDALEELFDQ